MIANGKPGVVSRPSRRSNWWLAPLLIAISIPAQAQIDPEAGAFFINQYLPQMYGADPQNWAVLQDRRGVMFFGNTEGLLEYDGTRWRHLSLPNKSTVRSLALDPNGTIYVGGQGEFGFLKPDALGTLQYVSLLNNVPTQDRHFGDVWTISCTQSGVYFSSYQRIFRWSPESSMKIWRPSARFGRVFTTEDKPYVVVEGEGLNTIVGDVLRPVPGGDIFKHDVTGVFFFGNSLLVASSSALYRQSGNEFVRFPNEAEALLKTDRIYTCRPIRDGDLAIGTVRTGLILLTPDGRVDRIIDKRTGLASDFVDFVYGDREGSLWAALSRGIAHIETELPLTRFGEAEGLDEIVLAVARRAGTLYAGTMTGLSRLAVARGKQPTFEPVDGIEGQVLALQPTGQDLLIGGQYGVFDLGRRGIRSVLVGEGWIYSLSPSLRDPTLMFAGGRRGLFVLHSTHDGWKKLRQVPSDGQDFLSVLDDSDGNVWITTRTAIWQIALTDASPRIERFSAAQGVPPGWNYAYRIKGRVVFATGKGLRRFDPQQRRFIPDQSLGPMFADGSHPVLKVAESASGDIWIGGDTYHGILHPNGTGGYRWDENPLARSGIKELYGLHLDQNNVAWASGADGGLVRDVVWSTSAPSTRFQTLITDAQLLRNGEALGATESVPKIRHQQNSLRFQFSAPLFEDESRTEYQVRLRGLDRAWSEWSNETRKEYTNLWEGHYAFEVRARDLHGRISQEASFAFRILPPWYRTWWAYTLYVPLVLGFIALIVGWRLRALKERNRKLESIIERRTAQIRKQNVEIKEEEKRTQKLLLNILPASVAEELRATGSVQPMTFDSITVCFTDFVGFTLSSESITAPELVAGLHRYFTIFDEIVTRYGLEKLKTIGDSYMFVGGLPNPTSSHAVDVVLAAIELQHAVNALSDSHPSWKARIGVHTGPVVAGVVGVKKFAYDIWGETVNFASRHESSGAPGRVNISQSTYELVQEFIDCEPRGRVRIKEGHLLEMYFARQIRAEFLDENSDVSNSFVELYSRKFGKAPSFPSIGASAAIPQSIVSL